MIFLVHRRYDNLEYCEDKFKCDRVLGVFDTREKAKEAIKNYKHSNSENFNAGCDRYKEKTINSRNINFFPDPYIFDYLADWNDCEREYFTLIYFRNDKGKWKKEKAERYGLYIEEKELNVI